jgi:hypothetical protein
MRNNTLLFEQRPDHLMFGQPETFGYNPKKPQTMDAALAKQQEFFKSIRKYVNVDMESDLRDFLYSPEGIATIAGIGYVGGEPISMLLFSILVAYDIKQWIDEGEPNWLFLITDLICVGTAGFASSAAAPLIKLGKNVKFNSLTSLFRYISKNFKSLWKNYVLPLSKSIGQVIGKITSTITKAKPSLSGKLSSSLSSIVSYLSKLNGLITESIEAVIGKAGLETGKTYAKYKIASKVASKAGQTDIGKKVMKTSLPYINPLLGSDKIDPFLMDLITSPQSIDYKSYTINPIFADNSKDTF